MSCLKEKEFLYPYLQYIIHKYLGTQVVRAETVGELE